MFLGLMGLNLLNNLIGANVPNKQHVGGRLGIGIDRNVPGHYRQKVQDCQQIPTHPKDSDVLQSRKRAVAAEEIAHRVKKISEQRLREAEAWAEADAHLMEHNKGLVGISAKHGFKQAGYLKTMQRYGFAQQEAEIEVSTAADVAAGLINGIW